jgi:uncharacterized protein YjeT (DUF2065 family)
MELSVFLAKVYGLVLVVVGLGMIFNKAYYHKMLKDLVAHSGFMYAGGVLALVVGVVLVLYHNVWVKSWVVIITLFAWCSLLKGVLLLLVPQGMTKLCQSVLKNDGLYYFMGILALVLGVLLGYYGFFA